MMALNFTLLISYVIVILKSYFVKFPTVLYFFKAKSNLAKDILLSVSIALALSGMAYAFHVRRTAGLAVSAMQEKLIILQKEMTKLDEDYPWYMFFLRFINFFAQIDFAEILLLGRKIPTLTSLEKEL